MDSTLGKGKNGTVIRPGGGDKGANGAWRSRRAALDCAPSLFATIPAMAAITQPFWKRKTLDQLDAQEWESLCDGCGLCCLQKLEDEDDGAVYYTRIACKLLDLKTCQCSRYAERTRFVPDCIQLTPAQADQFAWLPPTCGYRLVAEGKDLPEWHPLICDDPEAVHKAGISQSGRMLSETQVAEDDWEDYLIFRAG
jgi:uncharacterized cysteine cluster protein YcgN (CxxCxxCC family)